MSASLHEHYILLTDIGRSSYLWEAFPEEYPTLLARHNDIVEAAVASAHGVVMKNTGDGFFALFDTAPQAVAAAVELQLGLASGLAFSDGTLLTVRAVVHAGPLHQLAGQEGDWFGPPLNRTARICGVCHAGQVLISGPVQAGLAATGEVWELTDLGRCRLRDLGEPEQLFQLTHPGFAQQSFPPLLTLDSVPNNLAIQPNAFIGRDKELSELARLLGGDTRLLTLHAPGGYGKTRLASQLAAQLLGRFANGVFEVALAPISSAERLPEAVATATGFQFFGAREPREQILDYLRNKEMLLVFDNFEHVMAGASFIGEILQTAAKVRIIATSREPLRLAGERVHKLDPLPTGAGSEAVQLFADRAARVKPGFALDEQRSEWAEKICARLEGVPLSIELAAAWADMFSLLEMYSELGQQLELAARLSDVPERQRSVRASCDWSWGLLTAEQRVALMKLSTFKGGFFLEAAKAVLGLSGFALRGMLAGLCDKSWLFTREIEWTILGESTAQTRWFLRDAASHEYVEMRLAELGELEQQALSTHGQYFADLMATEGPRLSGAGCPDGGRVQLIAINSFQEDAANIYAAMDRALSAGRAELVGSLGLHLLPFVAISGGALRMRQICHQILEGAAGQEDQAPLLAARLGLAGAERLLGNYPLALSLVEESAILAHEFGDLHSLAKLLLVAAMVHFDSGNLEEAASEIERSLALLELHGDQRSRAEWTNVRANVSLLQGRAASAIEDYSAVHQFGRQTGNLKLEANALYNMGRIQDDYRQGLERFEQAEALYAHLGDRAGYASCLNNRGSLLQSLGEPVGALELHLAALQIFKELGQMRWAAYCLCGTANYHFSFGDPKQAWDYRAEALEIMNAIGDRLGAAECLSSMGLISLAYGDAAQACDSLQRGIQLAVELSSASPTVAGTCCAGALLAQIGQFSAAASLLAGSRLAIQRGLFSPAPVEQKLAEAAQVQIQSALVGGAITANELAQWQAKGEAMTLEELAQFALQALGTCGLAPIAVHAS